MLSYLWSAAQTEFYIYLPYVVQRLGLLLNINCFISVFTCVLLFVFLRVFVILCRRVLSFCVINEYVYMYEAVVN